MMSNVQVFFEEQNGQMEGEFEVDNPICLPKLNKRVDKNFLGVLNDYKEELESRVRRYRSKIDQI